MQAAQAGTFGEEMLLPSKGKKQMAMWGAGEKRIERSEEEFEQFWADLEAEAQETAIRVEGKDEVAGEHAGATEAEPELTFEQKVDKVVAVIDNKSSHREILRKILVYCQQRRGFSEVETEIQTYPEYKYAAQNPYRLITYLVEGEGLRKIELDEEGVEILAERKEGLTEDEIDDLVADYALETTEAGKEAAARKDSKRRIRDLVSLLPKRQQVYVKILELCQQPRTMAALDEAISTMDLASIESMNEAAVALKPSAFVAKMERAGGIVWDNGWNITEEGAAFLAKFSEQSSAAAAL